jgi:hypothetical protein
MRAGRRARNARQGERRHPQPERRLIERAHERLGARRPAPDQGMVRRELPHLVELPEHARLHGRVGEPGMRRGEPLGDRDPAGRSSAYARPEQYAQAVNALGSRSASKRSNACWASVAPSSGCRRRQACQGEPRIAIARPAASSILRSAGAPYSEACGMLATSALQSSFAANSRPAASASPRASASRADRSRIARSPAGSNAERARTCRNSRKSGWYS